MVIDNRISVRQATPPRTEIRIETRTTVIIRTSSGGPRRAFCDRCCGETADIPIPNAALIFGSNVDELGLLQAAGDLHLTSLGGLCGMSLAEQFKKDIREIED
jgi:hypothetical protein